MGIPGLLPVIKPICESKHVTHLARTRVGIDVYGWLHRGIFSCALKVCRGIETTAYVDYCMHRVRMLLHFNVTPVLVFDGAELPMKKQTHQQRKQRRNEAKQKADSAYAAGDMKTAMEFYQRACPVTGDMARMLMKECKKINVEFIVAPYEADAQLTWMMNNGIIDSVITEDSDLLVYGARKILYKFTKEGNADWYESKNLAALDTISMHNFSEDMFLYMCVCAGCDFFKGVQGLGIRKAHALVKKFRSLTRLISVIRMDRKYKVDKTFTIDFVKACLVFRHQTVYDMKQKKLVHLKEIDQLTRASLPHGVLKEEEDWQFLGMHHEDSIATKIANGLVNPYSLKEYEQPIDDVMRPLASTEKDRERVTKKSFHAMPVSASQMKVRRDVKGFQVQPVVREKVGMTTMTPNLRQRLALKGNPFNPRLAALQFRKRQNAGNGGTSSKIATDVFERFKSRRGLSKGIDKRQAVKLDEEQKEKNVDVEEIDSCTKPKGDDVVFVSSTPVKKKRTSDNDTEDLDKAECDEEPIILGSQSPQRQDEPTVYRAKKMRKVMDRFAQKSRSKRFKFAGDDPENNDETIIVDGSQPVPDTHTLSLFEEVDRSDDSENETPIKPSSTKHIPRKGQQLISRFFGTPTNTPERVALSSTRKRGLVKDTDSSVGEKPLTSLDTFRRGAAGKSVRVVDKKT